MESKVHFSGLREERPQPDAVSGSLPKMPVLGGALDSIAERAESIIHAASNGRDESELNDIRQEGIQRIAAVEEAHPGLLAKLDTTDSLSVFHSEISPGFNKVQVMQQFFSAIEKLRPLANGLIQRSSI